MAHTLTRRGKTMIRAGVVAVFAGSFFLLAPTATAEHNPNANPDHGNQENPGGGNQENPGGGNNGDDRSCNGVGTGGAGNRGGSDESVNGNKCNDQPSGPEDPEDPNNNDDPVIGGDPVETAAPASLQIIAAVEGDAPPTWTFSYSGDLGGFALDNVGPSDTTTGLAAGTYVVTQADHPDSDLTAISCTAGLDAVPSGSTVTVTLAEGDSGSCTFINDFGEVQGEVVERPTPAPPAPAPAPEPEVPQAEVLPDVQQRPTSLPRTGDETRDLAGAGLILVGLGTSLVGASRREELLPVG